MPAKKNPFTIHEGLLTLCEVGEAGPTRMQVQQHYNRLRDAGEGPLQAIRETEKSLKIWDLTLNASGDTVVHYVDEETLKESAPAGFILYHDGIYHGYARKTDGAGLRDLHQSGECPKDCPYCKGADKLSTQDAKHAGERAKATSKHWKSGRLNEDVRNEKSPCCHADATVKLKNVAAAKIQYVLQCKKCDSLFIKSEAV